MKKPVKEKVININSFLWLGIALVVGTAVLSRVIKGMPVWLSTALYLVGICAFLFYMLEIQYRRRTGDYHDDSKGYSADNTKKGKKRK